MTIRNGLQRTIFVSGGLGLSQIVSKSGTKRSASEDARLPKGGGGL